MGSAMGEAAGKPSAIAYLVSEWLSADECHVTWRLAPHNAMVDIVDAFRSIRGSKILPNVLISHSFVGYRYVYLLALMKQPVCCGMGCFFFNPGCPGGMTWGRHGCRGKFMTSRENTTVKPSHPVELEM